MEKNKKYLLRFGNGGRYLKSYTLTKKGDVDEITTTGNKENAMHFELNDAAEYKTGLFKLFKPDIVEKDAMIIYIPSYDDYRLIWERKLQKATNEQVCNEIISRLDGCLKLPELRERLGYCFGYDIDINYTNSGEEVNIEEVFKNLKYGGKAFINGLTQYRWQCHEHVEIIELGKNKESKHMWVRKRYVVDFKYKSALEMLTDKNIRFPRTGYKEGYICERVWFGNSHDYVENKDGKTIIKPYKEASYNIYEG